MAFFDRFRRRDDEGDDPSYYRNEPTTNKFTAVLFGFFALFVTLLIAGGLFFGGRAVYRALNGTPAENTAEQKKQDDQSQDKPDATPAPGTSSDDSSSNQNPNTQPNTGDTPTSVPSTGDTPAPSTSLPRTGDEGL